MQQHILPINEILVEDRQRIDLGDIDILADSLSKYGLIQPIVINQNKRLIAGGRRLTAAKKLGWTEIKVVYLETLTEEDLTIRELEENIQRKAMTWKEEVAAVYKMHKLLDKRAHFDGNSWTQEQTGRMLGVSRASVGFTIQIAKELLNQSSKIHQCESYTEALRWCFQKREDEIQAELVSELKTQMEANRALVRETVKYVVEEEVDDKSSTLEPVSPLSSTEKRIIDLSNTIVHANCLSWLSNREPQSIDHILTDPPYGIDLNMLEQNNPHGGMNNIDRVEDTHQVESNLDLLSQFFPLAIKVLRERGFCILFCDQMNWQFLYDHAIKAGFRVQRWPFIWHKTHQCMNQRAEFNFTKNFEIAMVCRKPSSVLIKPQNSSIFSCSASGYMSNPFAKPSPLWDHLIEAISISGQTILDPFAGEGSCPSAVLSNWRIPIGIELEDRHYNVMLDTLKSKYNLMYRNPQFV